MKRNSGIANGSWLALLALAGQAYAHAVLTESSIALGAAAVKQNTEAHITLRFTGSIDPHGTTMNVVPERGDARSLSLVFGPGPGDIAATIPRLEAGRYELRYHVVATDGHVTEDRLPIRVIGPE